MRRRAPCPGTQVAGCEARRGNPARLCVTEAVTNAVIHVLRRQPNPGTIVVTAEIEVARDSRATVDAYALPVPSVQGRFLGSRGADPALHVLVAHP
jgi:hypothetical protein